MRCSTAPKSRKGSLSLLPLRCTASAAGILKAVENGPLHLKVLFILGRSSGGFSVPSPFWQASLSTQSLSEKNPIQVIYITDNFHTAFV
jgi:hypothetical protein